MQRSHDTAFPGTNPWERLGAGNPSGQVSVTDQQTKQKNRDAKLQATVQTAQQSTQKEVAQIAANAHIQSAQIAAGVTRGGIDPGGYRDDVTINAFNAATNRGHAATNRFNAGSNRINTRTNQSGFRDIPGDIVNIMRQAPHEGWLPKVKSRTRDFSPAILAMAWRG